MEKARNLETQAITISEKATKLLTKPDGSQEMLRLVTPYGPKHGLELRVSMYAGEDADEDDIRGSRDIFLFNVSPRTGREKVIFSQDLNNLEEEGMFKKRSMSRLPKKPFGVSTETIQLVHSVVELTKGDTSKIDEVSSLYANIIEEGGLYTTRYSKFSLKNGATLSIDESKLQGSLEHHFPQTVHDAELKISVENPEPEQTIIFQKLRNGSHETYAVKSILDEELSYAREENISYDEDGNIGPFLIHEADQVAIEEASRAMGLRDLKEEYCDAIEQALNEVQMK